MTLADPYAAHHTHSHDHEEDRGLHLYRRHAHTHGHTAAHLASHGPDCHAHPHSGQEPKGKLLQVQESQDPLKPPEEREIDPRVLAAEYEHKAEQAESGGSYELGKSYRELGSRVGRIEPGSPAPRRPPHQPVPDSELGDDEFSVGQASSVSIGATGHTHEPDSRGVVKCRACKKTREPAAKSARLLLKLAGVGSGPPALRSESQYAEPHRSALRRTEASAEAARLRDLADRHAELGNEELSRSYRELAQKAEPTEEPQGARR